jgi:hypothetical protein
MKVLQDVGMTPGQDIYVHAAPNALNVATNQQQIQLKGFDMSLPSWKFMEIWNPWNLEVLLSSQSFWRRTTAVMSMAGLLQAFFLPSFHYGRTLPASSLVGIVWGIVMLCGFAGDFAHLVMPISLALEVATYSIIYISFVAYANKIAKRRKRNV